MKTTVVPAQITTVEDRIAGNLTLPQIVLLIIPLLISTVIYACLPVKMHFNLTKYILIGWQFLFFGLLAVRFRGKIVADWLVIYSRFKLRPRQYIFTKNDLTGRDIEIVISKESLVEETQSEEKPQTVPVLLSLKEKIKIDRLMANPAFSISFKLGKKGGFDVSLKPVKD